jgi:hypothetical protein
MKKAEPKEKPAFIKSIFIAGLLGWVLVIIAYIAFPVFAPDTWICEGPYGSTYGCGYIEAPIHTLWTFEQHGGHGAPLSFIGLGFVVILFLLALAVKHRFITTIALVVSLIWIAYLGLLLYELIPHPLPVGYIIAAILASVGSLTIVGGNIAILRKPTKTI